MCHSILLPDLEGRFPRDDVDEEGLLLQLQPTATATATSQALGI